VLARPCVKADCRSDQLQLLFNDIGAISKRNQTAKQKDFLIWGHRRWQHHRIDVDGAVVMIQAEEQKLEMASKSSTEFDSRLADMRREMDECRGEAARVKVEASHLSAALREAEATKKSKDRQLTELQQ